MKYVLILAGLLFIANSTTAYATEETFFIIGDHVDIRVNPSWEDQGVYQENWGRKFIGHQVNQEWYTFQDYDYAQVYVPAHYVVPETMFYQLAEQQQEKNGRTKYELLKHYKAIGQVRQAEEVSFDLINNYRKEVIVLGFEHLDCLGYLAYFEMRGDDYHSQDMMRYTEDVIQRSQDRVVTVLAYADQAHYYLQHGRLDQAEPILWKILTDYAHDLIVPVPVEEYDAWTKVYPIIHVKNLFFVLYALKNPSEATELWDRLNELRQSQDIAVQSLANDLYKMQNIWDYKEYLSIIEKRE